MIVLKQWLDAVTLTRILADEDDIHVGKDYVWVWNKPTETMAMEFKVVDLESIVILKYQHVIDGDYTE